MYPKPSTKASVLFLTIWTICLLASLGLLLAAGVRQKLSLISRLDERGKLRGMCQAGVMRALMWLQKEDPLSFIALKDPWSNNPEVFQGFIVGEGIVNICYNATDETGANFLRYGLIDEERKININTAELSVLKRLFQAAGLPDMEAQDLAACIIDWRDQDSLLSSPGSAEDGYYATLSPPYRSKNAEFQVLEELLLVKGMRENLFEALKGALTCYGSGKVNINTAPREVLLALGLSGILVDKILEFRRGQDRVEGTTDDFIFGEQDDPVLLLTKMYPCTEKEALELTVAKERYLTSSSATFMIISHAQLPHKHVGATITCIASSDGSILRWKEA